MSLLPKLYRNALHTHSEFFAKTRQNLCHEIEARTLISNFISFALKKSYFLRRIIVGMGGLSFWNFQRLKNICHALHFYLMTGTKKKVRHTIQHFWNLFSMQIVANHKNEAWFAGLNTQWLFKSLGLPQRDFLATLEGRRGESNFLAAAPRDECSKDNILNTKEKSKQWKHVLKCILRSAKEKL